MKTLKYFEYRTPKEFTYFHDKLDLSWPETLGYPFGWRHLVHELIGACFDAGWNGHLLQVKEKFGGLRFYIEGGQPEEVYRLIREAEDKSELTCQDCGLPGRLYGGSWIRALCPDHADLRDQKKEI